MVSDRYQIGVTQTVKTKQNIEILFVAGSSLDRRGKRILVREANVENYIFPEDGVDLVDLKLLGISEAEKVHIEQFFSKRL